MIFSGKQGISKKFLTYFNQFDKTVGERALGKDQTLTGKITETLTNAHAQARSVDEKKGYTAIAHDVSLYHHTRCSKLSHISHAQAVLL